jgi:hypothetical protein
MHATKHDVFHGSSDGNIVSDPDGLELTPRENGSLNRGDVILMDRPSG